MEPIPLHTRQRIILLYEEGEQTSEIVEQTGYCPAAVRRMKQILRERGTLEPMTHRCGRKGNFTPQVQQRLRELVRITPDATLAKLREALSPLAEVSISTVDRWLKKLKLSLKKSR